VCGRREDAARSHGGPGDGPPWRTGREGLLGGPSPGPPSPPWRTAWVCAGRSGARCVRSPGPHSMDLPPVLQALLQASSKPSLEDRERVHIAPRCVPSPGPPWRTGREVLRGGPGEATYASPPAASLLPVLLGGPGERSSKEDREKQRMHRPPLRPAHTVSTQYVLSSRPAASRTCAEAQDVYVL
jgi:hypothetical protein